MPGPRARYHLERIRESVWDVVANGALKITYGELKKGLDENKDVSWVSDTKATLKGTGFEGSFEVTADQVVVAIKLGFLAKAFKGQVEEILQKKLTREFEA